MSTLHVTAHQIVVQAAAMLNDPLMTDYNDVTVTPYLNMAINELNESLEESNVAASNQVSPPYHVKVGASMLVNLPHDIIEIQEVGERNAKSNDPFILLPRREFPDSAPASSSLLYWYWHGQQVKFNPSGANTPKEVQLKYIARPFKAVQLDNETTVIGTVNADTYLVYKTAALCAMFVGENPTRAAILQDHADKALERIIAISNKGRQQIMTRHRPFRAGWKTRGGF